MNRIWEQTGDAPDRSRRGDQVDGRSYPGDGPLPVDGGRVVDDKAVSTSTPRYEDLYGSPPPVDTEMTEPIGPVMGASDEFGIGDEGIRWDDERETRDGEASVSTAQADESDWDDDESDWDDEDQSDWEE